MTNVLLGVYFIIIGAIGLFGLAVDPKLLSLIALIIGILVLVSPYAGRILPPRA